MAVADRIYRLLKSYGQGGLEALEAKLAQGKGTFNHKLDELEKEWEDPQFRQQQSYQPPPRPSQPPSQWPQELVDDLAVFGLRPPATLAEVKKIRNQEIRKYHPDRFANDPEREMTAKEILQIYNGAYERLEKRLG